MRYRNVLGFNLVAGKGNLALHSINLHFRALGDFKSVSNLQSYILSLKGILDMFTCDAVGKSKTTCDLQKLFRNNLFLCMLRNV